MKLAGLLLGMLLCGMLAAEDSSDPGVKTKVIALEKAWNQAYKLGDKNALADLLDDQVVLIDDGAMVSKSEFLRTIKPVHMAEQQLSPGTITVTVHGSSAIATGVFQSKGVEAGKKYARRERFLDTWVNKNGKWVCVAAMQQPWRTRSYSVSLSISCGESWPASGD